MRLVRSREVQALTGLSGDQLREWTHRRGLIPPDVKPHGSGTQALYSWRTVLLLRLAADLRNRFHLELQAHRDLFAQLRLQFDGVAFHSLWGKAVVLEGTSEIDIVDAQRPLRTASDFLFLRFDPHLEVLSRHFGTPEDTPQLPLFPVVALR
jgi:hypothetical protein